MANMIKDGSATLDSVTSVEVELEFEQAKKGFLGGLRNKVDPADPDLILAVMAAGRPVDYVEPKNRPDRCGGALHHDGDGRGNGSEVVRVHLDRLAAQDSDLDGIAVVATIARGAGDEGFSRIAGGVARIFDTSSGERAHMGNVRLTLGSRHTCAVVAVMARNPQGVWTLRTGGRVGYAEGWEAAARFAASDLRYSY